jgi:hypothetical protein
MKRLASLTAVIVAAGLGGGVVAQSLAVPRTWEDQELRG